MGGIAKQMEIANLPVSAICIASVWPSPRVSGDVECRRALSWNTCELAVWIDVPLEERRQCPEILGAEAFPVDER